MWFKFGGGADSLLWVGYTASVHDAVVGSNHLAVVTDVHGRALTGGTALAFAGP